MTVGELIKKLASYELDDQVFLVNLSDDSGDEDVMLTPEAIDKDHGHVLICHTPPPTF